MITYLKIVVIVLGVLIAAGVAVIGVKLAEKNDELAERGGDAVADAVDVAPEAVATPARRGLGLPAGAQVRRMAVGEGRLVLAVAVPGAGERIVIVDLRDGRMVAAIALEGAR